MDRSTTLGLVNMFGPPPGPEPRIPGQKVPGKHPAAHARRDDRLRAVAVVAQAVREGGANDDLLHLIAEQARLLVDAATTLVLLPEGTAHLRVRAAEGGDADLLRDMYVPAHRTLAGAVLRTGQARNVGDVSVEREAHGRLAGTGLFGPSILVPLTVRAHVVAVIQVGNRAGAPPFTPEDFRTLRLFTAQVGLAVETRLSVGVTLLDAVALQRRDADARADLERLAPAPLEMGTLLRQTLDRLARTIVELTHVDACSIQLLDPEVPLRTGGAFGLPSELLSASNDAFYRGAAHLALEAITSDGPVVVVNERERLLTDPRFGSVADLVTQLRWDAACCLPFQAQSGTRGAVCYYFTAENRPDEADIRLIKAMAAQAATVVDNARLLAAANETVAIEERQHLARELHDSVSQALYGIALGARATLEHLDHDPRRAREPVEYILQLAESGLAEMRALIFELRAEYLETEGLAAALAKQVDMIRARSGIDVEMSAEAVPESPVAAHQTLFRIGQEALQNAAKHASAQHVRVRLSSADDRLVLEVSDDGRGFNPTAQFPGHLGLRSMQERAEAVGGTLEVSSRPGAGTRVRATVPRSPGHERARD